MIRSQGAERRRQRGEAMRGQWNRAGKYGGMRELSGRTDRLKHVCVWLPLTHPLLGTWPATQACALTGN